MAYSKQQWQDGVTADPYGGVSADRLSHIEDGIDAAQQAADDAAALAIVAPGAASVNTAALQDGAVSRRKTDDYYYNGGLSVHRPYPRTSTLVNISGQMTSGAMNSYAVVLHAGDVITNIAFRSATTALTQGSNNDGHWWFALYDTQATPALLGQTADQTTGAWAATLVKSLALASPQTISTTGVHYASIMVNAGTGGSPAVPTLLGIAVGTSAVADGFVASQKKLSVQSGSGLAATAPGTITSTTSNSGIAYFELS